MPRFDADTIYDLLPAIYRIRDADQDGQPLRALVEILAEQGRLVEDNIGDLYDNWFIETCEEWVVPYIGDLIGARHLRPIDAGAEFSQRARVANTIGYRRRKGTAAMLEQLARDTTSWNARAVEFFQFLGWTQNYNHVRLQNHRSPDLRDANQLELLGTAFDTISHSVDVRRISSGRGQFNIPNVGLYLWRLQAYPMVASSARLVPDLDPAAAPRYTFDALGLNTPLFNLPRTENEITHLATELNVPGILRRRPLFAELEEARQAIAEGGSASFLYFSKSETVVQFEIDGIPVSAERILVCNLEDLPDPTKEPQSVESQWGAKPDADRKWRVPPAAKDYQLPGESSPPEVITKEIDLAFDPALGRIALPEFTAGSPPGSPPDGAPRIRIRYSYGFSGDVGAGPFQRHESVTSGVPSKLDWQVAISGDQVESLSSAVAQWNSLEPGKSGLIVLTDSLTYDVPLTGPPTPIHIQIPSGSHLAIIAAQQDDAGTIVADQVRPHLLRSLSVTGTAPAGDKNPGELFIDGLLIEGAIKVDGQLDRVALSHCTLRPASGAAVHGEIDGLLVELSRSICGPIDLGKSAARLLIAESIVMCESDTKPLAINAPSAQQLSVDTCTVLGSTHSARLDASNSIFTDLLSVQRQQEGCVRFSFVPHGSRTPRRYRCQPDLALSAALEVEQKGPPAAPNATLSASQTDEILTRIVPSFTSETYGHPGFCQLARHIPDEIFTGAEDGSEMGVFSILKQAQRVANLEASVSDYLPLGLEAGITFAT